jgi:uncharacterized membrane protein
MSSRVRDEENFVAKNRLEALVDGVFAFAMTLLVVSLTIPSIPKAKAAVELPVYISGMTQEFMSFIIAFLLLAVFWTVHHRHFHFLRTINSRVLWLNIFILIGIVLVPFTTSVSGDYSDVPIAVILFHVNLLAIGLLFLVHWCYITHVPGLIEPPVDERTIWWGIIRGFVTPVVAVTAIILALFVPSYSTLTYLLIPPSMILIRGFSGRQVR